MWGGGAGLVQPKSRRGGGLAPPPPAPQGHDAMACPPLPVPLPHPLRVPSSVLMLASTQGYLNNAAATAATIDAEGYLHTGDLGYMDADGDCYIVDRCKELIKVKGFQVAPAELEDVLQGHPAVQDCAVVGITVDGEEYPKAFIVLREGVAPAAPLAKEIIDVAARQTAPYKRIRDVAFIQAIPKSASGKILRRELRLLPSKL